jgi:hypothetical protein
VTIPGACLTSAASNNNVGETDLHFHAPALRQRHKADTGIFKPAPVFLNSKEVIGWKAPLQNSNLSQEAV